MTTLDDRIRSLVHDRVAESPAPLTAEELEARWVDLVPRAEHRRRVWPALVAVAAAAAAVVTVVLIDRHDDRVDHPATPHIREDQLLLPPIPEGWTVLDVSETVSEFGDGASQTAVYVREDPAVTLMVSYAPQSAASAGYYDHFESAVGPGSWGNGCGGACFDLNPVVGGHIEGQLTANGHFDESMLLDVVSHLSISAEGLLVLDPASGYVLDRSGRTSDARAVTLLLSLGRVDGNAGTVSFGISSGADLRDAALSVSAEAIPKVVDDQTYWFADFRGMGAVTWSRNGARYEIFGGPHVDVLAMATLATRATEADVRRIIENDGKDATVTDSVDLNLANRSLRFEERQLDNWSFVCLADTDRNVCRNIQSGGYSSLVLNGHWYVVQAYRSDIAIPNTGNIVVGRSRWRVAAIADNITDTNLGEDGSITRPAW